MTVEPDSTNAPTQVHNVKTFSYCPLCGAELDKEEEQVAEYSWILEVNCPQHGELVLVK